MRGARDVFVMVCAMAVFMALSPLLLVATLFFEEEPEYSYMNQNW